MKITKKLCNGIDFINDWIGRVMAFSVLIILAVIMYEVLLRRVFSSPQIWTMDMICMSFGVYVIMICAYGFQKKAFVAVDVLYARLPLAGQHILHIITYFIFLVPFIFSLVPESANFFYRSFLSGEKSYSVWGPVLWPLKLALFVGLTLLAMQAVSEILKKVIWVVSYYKNGKQAPSENYMKEGL